MPFLLSFIFNLEPLDIAFALQVLQIGFSERKLIIYVELVIIVVIAISICIKGVFYFLGLP